MPRRTGETCSRPRCGSAVMNRGLCKKHYPVAYPAHIRGDVDATRARRHLAALRGRGVTVKQLHLDHGISDRVIRNVQREPSKIRKTTEAKILAIPLPKLWVPSLADVDATGTRRRLQALGAIGYRQVDIGARIGVAQRHIPNITAQRKVSGATALRVARLFNELQMTPGPSEVSRHRAKLRGWPPPFAWDEDSIDDPDAEPYTGSSDDKVTWRQRYLAYVELGYQDDVIAARMGTTIENLERQLYRNGLQPQRVAS